MKKQVMLLTGLALAFSAAPVMAGQGFVRGEIGRADIDFDLSGVGSNGETDTTWSVRGGYYFSNTMAVEAFYSEFYDESTVFDDGTGTPITASGKLSGIGLGLVGKTHMGDDQTGWFVTGRVGVMRGKIEASLTGFGTESETSYKPYYGVGGGYDFSPKMGLSVNLDHYKGTGDGLSIAAMTGTVALEVRF
jgi:hypothetical protein